LQALIFLWQFTATPVPTDFSGICAACKAAAAVAAAAAAAACTVAPAVRYYVQIAFQQKESNL
jgi:hypothetical protein